MICKHSQVSGMKLVANCRQWLHLHSTRKSKMSPKFPQFSTSQKEHHCSYQKSRKLPQFGHIGDVLFCLSRRVKEVLTLQVTRKQARKHQPRSPELCHETPGLRPLPPVASTTNGGAVRLHSRIFSVASKKTHRSKCVRLCRCRLTTLLKTNSLTYRCRKDALDEASDQWRDHQSCDLVIDCGRESFTPERVYSVQFVESAFQEIFDPDHHCIRLYVPECLEAKHSRKLYA